MAAAGHSSLWEGGVSAAPTRDLRPHGEAAATLARPEALMAAGSLPPPATLPPAAGLPRDSLPPADGNWEE